MKVVTIVALVSVSDKLSNICNSSNSRIRANNLAIKVPIYLKQAKGHLTKNPRISAYGAMITTQIHEVGY